MAEPSTPLPASTVVLIRPDLRGRFEVYLNRRPAQMETYAGAHVFPGGRIEPCDYSPDMLALTRGLTLGQAQKKLGSELQPEICLAYWVAAARELFEEAGIHFFRSSGATVEQSLPQDTCARLAERRSALQRGEITLAMLLAAEGLCCDVTPLTYFFHRTTPEHYPIRFDTRFYLAVLPANQVPLHASEEVSESCWIAPELALARASAGDYRMMPPTLAVLRNLSSHQTWDEVRQAFGLCQLP